MAGGAWWAGRRMGRERVTEAATAATGCHKAHRGYKAATMMPGDCVAVSETPRK